MTADKDNKNKGCRLSLIIERPSLQHTRKERMLAKKQGKRIPYHPTGHAAIALDAGDGHQKYFSFGPGNKTSAKLFIVHKGNVLSDKPDFNDDSLTFDISESQYNKVHAWLEAKKVYPPKYSIVSYNCVDFAYDALKTAGIEPPTKAWISMPRMVSSKIREMETAYKTAKTKLGAMGQKVATKFSNNKVVRNNKDRQQGWSSEKQGVPMSLLTRLGEQRG